METSDRARSSLPVSSAPSPATEAEGLSDSPWFWVTLFGAVALVSLLGIQGKFAQRQARLEQRYQDRLLAQQARTKAAASATTAETPVEPGYDEAPIEPEGVSMSAARARTSLVSLQIVAGAAVLVGLVGLQRRKRRMLESATST